MLIPSESNGSPFQLPSLSRRVNANSQRSWVAYEAALKLIKKGEC